MTIYINRVLNLKHIKAIGFDMDYTLVRYNAKAFEKLSHDVVKEKLVKNKNYPKEVLDLKFNYKKALRGLVLDRTNGNIIKVSTHGKIKQAYHGISKMLFNEQKAFYSGLSIDLNDDNYTSVDTSFSIAHMLLFAQLVDLKDNTRSKKIPSYDQIDIDIKEQLDIAHMDGSLKDVVTDNLKKYIIKDKETVEALLNFKKNGKKLWVITNSDFHYTKALLDYTITPYLAKGETWADLFDIVITSSRKPSFFTDRNMFYEIDLETGYLKNTHGPFTKGIFHGGSATILQKDNGLHGDQILYLGDHIYGDILSLKKACHWRTALVIEELIDEVEATKKSKSTAKKIEDLMAEKEKLEKNLDKLYLEKYKGKNITKGRLDRAYDEIVKVDKKLGPIITKYQSYFNPTWGELMRAGQDPSSFAGQIERYACIYMSKVSDLSAYSPRFYFRPKKRPLSHEL